MTFKKFTHSLLIAASCLSSQVVTAAEYQPYTTYADGDGVRDELTLLTYEGENAFFSYNPTDFPEITSTTIENTLLPLFSQTVENFRLFGHSDYVRSDAHPAYPNSGKGSVAVVTRTCGAGCGAGGGSEISDDTLRQQINGTLYNPHNYNYERDPASVTAWWVGLYELGRGVYFDFYDELTYRKTSTGGQDIDYIANAFPQLVAHVSMTDAGASAAEIAADSLHPLGHFKDLYLDLVNNQGVTYMDFHPADGSRVAYNQNIPTKAVGANDVMAMLMYEFYLRYGKDALASFFKVLIEKDQAASSNIEAVCNFGNAMDIALLRQGNALGLATQFLQNEFAFPSMDDCPDFQTGEAITQAHLLPSILSDNKQYLHNAYFTPFVSPLADITFNDLAKSWQFEHIGGNVYRIRNLRKLNEYLNIENGSLVSSEVPVGYWSSHWQFISLNDGSITQPTTKTSFAIQNRWKPEQFIVYSGTDQGEHFARSKATTIADESAHWQFDKITHSVNLSSAELLSYVNQKNEINIENGAIEVSQLPDGYWSSRWQFVPQGDNYYRIQNIWKPSELIHIENGIVETGDLPVGYISADWRFVNVVTGLSEAPRSHQHYVLQNRWKPYQMLGVQDDELTIMTYDISNTSAYWLLGTF